MRCEPDVVRPQIAVLIEHRLRSGIVKDKAFLIERTMRAEKRRKLPEPARRREHSHAVGL